MQLEAKNFMSNSFIKSLGSKSKKLKISNPDLRKNFNISITPLPKYSTKLHSELIADIPKKLHFKDEYGEMIKESIDIKDLIYKQEAKNHIINKRSRLKQIINPSYHNNTNNFGT